jgi:hypothetical protein
MRPTRPLVTVESWRKDMGQAGAIFLTVACVALQVVLMDYIGWWSSLVWVGWALWVNIIAD